MYYRNRNEKTIILDNMWHEMLSSKKGTIWAGP